MSSQQLTRACGLFSLQSSKYLTGYPRLLTPNIKYCHCRSTFHQVSNPFAFLHISLLNSHSKHIPFIITNSRPFKLGPVSCFVILSLDLIWVYHCPLLQNNASMAIEKHVYLSVSVPPESPTEWSSVFDKYTFQNQGREMQLSIYQRHKTLGYLTLLNLVLW